MSLGILVLLFHAGFIFGHGPINASLLPGSSETSGDLWRSYLSSWHDVGRGSGAATPSWILLLAIIGLLAGGSVTLVLVLLFSLFPALFAFSFALASRGLVSSLWIRVIVGTAIGVLPIFTHARDVGDFSFLIVAIVLPFLIRAASRAVVTGDAHRYALAALLLTLGSSSAQSPTPPPLKPSTCYPEYQSVFHFVDSTKTTEYSYDLRTLCGVDRWFAYPIPSNPSRFWNFYFAIGGNLSRQTFSCNPL
jgi:hypothetical protein